MESRDRVLPMDSLRAAFGERLQENAVMANYTTARTGGPVDALLPVNSVAELEEAALRCWELEAPFIVLGGGSNVLFSDTGVHAVVLLNRARNTRIDANALTAWTESGANFSSLARQTALRGLSGLEWAAAIPGTVGGAVYGNAGAFGSDVAHNLVLAEILHPESGRQTWTVEQFQYGYRSSLLKRQGVQAVVLAAEFHLAATSKDSALAKVEANTAQRRQTQPTGASMGSMFKNPSGDFAGRLIEAAGLKGHRIGDAEISSMHANFFINHGGANAADIYRLVRLVQETVADRFGVRLELEIELHGDFETI